MGTSIAAAGPQTHPLCKAQTHPPDTSLTGARVQESAGLATRIRTMRIVTALVFTVGAGGGCGAT